MWASEEHRRLQASLLQVSHNNLPWLKINEIIFQTFWKEEGCAKFLFYELEMALNSGQLKFKWKSWKSKYEAHFIISALKVVY